MLSLIMTIWLSQLDGPRFYELIVQQDPRSMTFEVDSLPFHANRHEAMRWPVIKKTIEHLFLDSPIRQSIPFLLSLEKQRGDLFPRGLKQRLPLLKYKFELIVRKLDGDIVDRETYNVYLYLAADQGIAGVASKLGGETRFRVEDLETPETQAQFFSQFFSPLGKIKFDIPKEDEFVVSHVMTLPKMHAKLINLWNADLHYSAAFQHREQTIERKVPLATTLCVKNGDRLDQYHSEHLKFLSDTNMLLDTYAELKRNGAPGQSLSILRDYLNRLPSDQMAMYRLFKTYVALDKKVLAWEFATEYMPILGTIDEVVSFVAEYEHERMLGRQTFYEKRDSFAQNDEVDLRILSPEDGQLIGGSDVVTFEIVGFHRPFFRADLFLNDALAGFVEKPPYAIPVTFDRGRRYQTLKVVAYFEDESFAEHAIGVKTLPIDAQEGIQIRRLRAVVTNHRNKFRTNLGTRDFILEEDGKPIGIRTLELEKEPLSIALLIDTSSSMAGKKILHAQNAVHHFLSNLGEDDQASIYTFDQKVMKMSDFTTNRTDIRPELFTLQPMFGTTLYDAIFIAHQALLKEKGTRVIVLLSDGMDGISKITADVVRNMLKESPVMVYSVVLTWERMNREAEAGKAFLHEIAALSGSTALDVRNTRHLERAFRHVCTELKSFYYLDYYSEKGEFDLDAIELRTVNRSLNTRYRKLVY